MSAEAAGWSAAVALPGSAGNGIHLSPAYARRLAATEAAALEQGARWASDELVGYARAEQAAGRRAGIGILVGDARTLARTTQMDHGADSHRVFTQRLSEAQGQGYPFLGDPELVAALFARVGEDPKHNRDGEDGFLVFSRRGDLLGVGRGIEDVDSNDPRVAPIRGYGGRRHIAAGWAALYLDGVDAALACSLQRGTVTRYTGRAVPRFGHVPWPTRRELVTEVLYAP